MPFCVNDEQGQDLVVLKGRVLKILMGFTCHKMKESLSLRSFFREYFSEVAETESISLV